MKKNINLSVNCFPDELDPDLYPIKEKVKKPPRHNTKKAQLIPLKQNKAKHANPNLIHQITNP